MCIIYIKIVNIFIERFRDIIHSMHTVSCKLHINTKCIYFFSVKQRILLLILTTNMMQIAKNLYWIMKVLQKFCLERVSQNKKTTLDRVVSPKRFLIMMVKILKKKRRYSLKIKLKILCLRLIITINLKSLHLRAA